MPQIITAALLVVFCAILGIISFIGTRYLFRGNERATEPLTLKCGRCGKVVYTSRTGNTIRPFTSSVQCATRKELKKIRG